MTTNITSAEYSTLNNYSVLAGSGISTSSSLSTDGVYGSYPTASYSGSITGSIDSANAGTAQTELTSLISNLTAHVSGLVLTPLSSPITTSITLYPNIHYDYTGFLLIIGPTIIFDAQGDVNAQFFITASNISFINGASISLINGASSCNIFWYAQGLIQFSNVANSTFYGIFIAVDSGILISGGSLPGTIQLYGRAYCKGQIKSTAAANFVINYTNCIPEPPIVCYAKGTLILTKRGFVPIEHIKAGYNVVTKGKIQNNKYINTTAKIEVERVLWVSKFRVIHLNEKSRPICIKQNALGKSMPFADLYVSPNHSLLLNGQMISAKHLVNGETIYQDTECEKVEYYHLECEQHSAIIANGVLSESYLDINNRDVFENSIKLKRRIKLEIPRC
jgi:hypothetical protein